MIAAQPLMPIRFAAIAIDVATSPPDAAAAMPLLSALMPLWIFRHMVTAMLIQILLRCCFFYASLLIDFSASTRLAPSFTMLRRS